MIVTKSAIYHKELLSNPLLIWSFGVSLAYMEIAIHKNKTGSWLEQRVTTIVKLVGFSCTQTKPGPIFPFLVFLEGFMSDYADWILKILTYLWDCTEPPQQQFDSNTTRRGSIITLWLWLNLPVPSSWITVMSCWPYYPTDVVSSRWWDV
jgi:hypothetical protein